METTIYTAPAPEVTTSDTGLFTQAQLDKHISYRLRRERKKYAQLEELNNRLRELALEARPPDEDMEYYIPCAEEIVAELVRLRDAQTVRDESAAYIVEPAERWEEAMEHIDEPIEHRCELADQMDHPAVLLSSDEMREPVRPDSEGDAPREVSPPAQYYFEDCPPREAAGTSHYSGDCSPREVASHHSGDMIREVASYNSEVLPREVYYTPSQADKTAINALRATTSAWHDDRAVRDDGLTLRQKELAKSAGISFRRYAELLRE